MAMALPKLDIVLHCQVCGAVVTTAWRPGKPNMPMVDCPCGKWHFDYWDMVDGYERAIKRESNKLRARYYV